MISNELLQSQRDFIIVAFPIFVGICVAAGLFQWSGALDRMTILLAPVMALFDLPPEVALSVVLGSVRKDGLAVGLLEGDWGSLKVPLESPVQLLTAVYLAGVLLPCLFTAITVAREISTKFALKMMGRQAGYAALFSLCIAWFGALLLSYQLEERQYEHDQTQAPVTVPSDSRRRKTDNPQSHP